MAAADADRQALSARHDPVDDWDDADAPDDRVEDDRHYGDDDHPDHDESIADAPPRRRASIAPWLILLLAVCLFGGGAWWLFSQPEGTPRPSTLARDTTLPGELSGEVGDPAVDGAPTAAEEDEATAQQTEPPPATTPTPDAVAVTDGPAPGSGLAVEGVGDETADGEPGPDAAAATNEDPAALPADAPTDVQDLVLAAQAGDGVAQHDLATWYAVEANPPDTARAAYWYEQSAENGIINAAYNLGVLLQQGQGVDQDVDRALGLYREAADANHSHAQNALGLAYLAGRGVTPDPVQAATWFSTAYANGNPRGAYYLGRIFEMGVDGAPDLSSAVAWYRVAAETGDNQALDALDRLGEPLQPTATAAPVQPVAAVAVDTPGEDAAVGPVLDPVEPDGADAGATAEPDEQVAAQTAAPTEAPTEAVAAADADPADTDDPALTRDDIRDVQRLLTDLGYDPGPVDGLMGTRTETAIAAFQAAQDLAETGEPTRGLLNALQAATP